MIDELLKKFIEFFRLNHHNYEPFPWQLRLMRRVLETEKWHDCIRIPTSGGKTSVIDCAVFWLAYCDNAPKRIIFTVDRRIVVDDSMEHAQLVCNNLANPGDNLLLQEMAENIRKKCKLLDEEIPITCYKLRGGIPRNNNWVESPMRPVILVSTVDQVGSRQLFRGYGCSKRTRSLHAALLTNDVMVFLDEPQISSQYLDTLQRIKQLRLNAEQKIITPFHLVTMSATPPLDITDIMDLGKDDISHPILGKRLSAKKPVALVRCKINNQSHFEELSDCFVAEAMKFKSEYKVIAVVVNETCTAKKTYSKLKKLNKNCHVILLTGRMRNFNRDKIVKKWKQYIDASVPKDERLKCDKVIFFVCTQCIEVGANLDFEAMVTECADIDSLRQRGGRLNRLGLLDKCAMTIVIGDIFIRRSHVIYGDSMKLTWKWLQKNKKNLDMGIIFMNKLLDATDIETRRGLCKPAKPQAVLTPAILDLLVQTEPATRVDVAPYLHGLDFSPDIQIVWRSDLPDTSQEIAIDIISACPPTPDEMMTIPLPAFRRWWKAIITNKHFVSQDGISDFVGQTVDEKDYYDVKESKSLYAIRWLGKDESELVTDLSKIVPGDLLVMKVPEKRYLANDFFPGQLDVNPDNPQEQSLEDIADQTSRYFFRLHPSLINTWKCDEKLRQSLLTIVSNPENIDWDKALTIVEKICPFSPLGGRIRGKTVSKSYPDQTGWIVYSKERDEVNSFQKSQSQLLKEHNFSVSKVAEQFATYSPGTSSHAKDIGLAGFGHDVGKSDIRFWRYLNDGKDPVPGSEPLAKSDSKHTTFEVSERRRIWSGWPKEARHEINSLHMLLNCPDFLEQLNDKDMVLHIVGCHHGQCRPFAYRDPNIESVVYQQGDFTFSIQDSQPTLEDIGNGIVQRFWHLIRQYGWWGLSWLECMVVLADHRCSSNYDYYERFDQ